MIGTALRPFRFASVLLLAASVHAQPAAFEVASIKPNNTGSGSSSESTGPGRVTAVNINISSLVQQAFGIKEFQISGAPAWVVSDRYDFNATTGTSKDLSETELEPYFESVLAERFHLKYHRETKEMQVYALRVAKTGARLTAHAGGGDSSNGINNGPEKTSLKSTNISMKAFAGTLGRRLDRMIIDDTGLTGGYDLTLEWAPNPSPDSTEPSLFTALQEQLGLKLESTKGPVEIIVIDSIERPSEN
jgi:uncharacterized protein (TIGR03435 family)